MRLSPGSPVILSSLRETGVEDRISRRVSSFVKLESIEGESAECRSGDSRSSTYEYAAYQRSPTNAREER